jgi:4-hydroxybenzoyl-CoA thioesterase
MSTITRSRRIRFSDCDPAGIIFYPQYFVLFNDLLEEWIDGIFPEGFAGYIVRRRFGIPTVRVEAEFKQVSRMGDEVILELDVLRVGTRSFDLALSCKGTDGVTRMSCRQTLVTTSLDTHRAIEIPPELRAALERR